MLINTRDFGEIEVSDENLLTFPVGVFAFEEAKQFALLSPLGEEVYPKWLQATHDFAPCFIVFDPAIVNEDYFDTVKLDAQDVKLLKISGGLTDNNDIRLLVIATVPEDFKKTTLNMKAPIVINVGERLAVQAILTADYDFRLPLYPDEEEVTEGESC
jgi:flagellar assembly factor FliW